MKRFCAAVIFILFAQGSALAQEKLVNIYNWSDYIDPRVIEEFTRETGIKVVYDTYDSNEVLETKLLTGKTGYDVVLPSATFLARQIQAGVFQKLDRTKLTNYKNLWPEVMQRLAAYDPGNLHAVNYMWFTTGIAYNVDQIRKRLGDRVLDSWDVVFKPENLRKLADCGVYMLDSPEDILASAARYLGQNPNSKDANDIRRAAETVARVKASVKKFHSSEYINALASGDICLAVGWAGDGLQARARAREAGNGVNIEYVIPKEGALMSLDNFAIPVDAPHVENAYRFIDFLLRPDIAARNTTITKFANSVLSSRASVEKEISENKSVYPDENLMKRLFTVSPNDQATQRIVTREWTRIKTGK